MKAFRSAVVEQRNWKQEITNSCDNTEQCHIRLLSSVQTYFCWGKEHGTTLECVSAEDNHNKEQAFMLQHEKTTKRCELTYADKRNKAEHNNLHVGDMIIMCHDNMSNKLSSAFSHTPMAITDLRGTAVTAADDNRTIRRNTSRFTKVFDPLPCSRHELWRN